MPGDVLVNSLTALPLHSLIGAPLTAAIEAQAAAAMSSVTFIKSVGFDEKTGAAVNVAFKYNRKKADGTPEEVTLEVPLLTIVNVPFIRIQDMTIDFEFKIHQVETKDTSTDTSLNVTAEASAKFAWLKAKTELKATYSRKDNEKSSLDRSATLNIHIRAAQDEMPAGLAEVLDILKNAIAPGGGQPHRAGGRLPG